ncbi:olfactory receptor 14J1-like [Caloenas nicobarica]|uniref:olfactory receptor 14J1-like n=1 Tax=Caloenas nicobarica TaxID=187106 RepID=UPI0032B7456E
MMLMVENSSLIDLDVNQGAVLSVPPPTNLHLQLDSREVLGFTDNSQGACGLVQEDAAYPVPRDGAEYFLLTVMSYDRYVAICKPLHYGTLLGSRACVHMAAAAWATGFLSALLHTANTFSLPLCKGNALDQFFCEIPQILKLSCSDASLRELGLLVVTVCLGFGCFVFIVLSYVQILRAVLGIPSEQGRHKAFATCLPHLTVVSLYVSTAIFSYLKPRSISSPSLDLVVSVLYSVVPPAVNPLIYSMRNQELKDALWKLIY